MGDLSIPKKVPARSSLTKKSPYVWNPWKMEACWVWVSGLRSFKWRLQKDNMVKFGKVGGEKSHRYEWLVLRQDDVSPKKLIMWLSESKTGDGKATIRFSLCLSDCWGMLSMALKECKDLRLGQRISIVMFFPSLEVGPPFFGVKELLKLLYTRNRRDQREQIKEVRSI